MLKTAGNSELLTFTDSDFASCEETKKQIWSLHFLLKFADQLEIRETKSRLRKYHRS
jgi:hypothetical protein